MSWSFSCNGPSENVADALDAYAESLSGKSKAEFEAVLPHLKGVVLQNVYPVTPSGQGRILFEANGRTYAADDGQETRSCNVTIKPGFRPV